MFRKKRRPAMSTDAVKEQARRIRPGLDARIASGEETDPLTLTKLLVTRALAQVMEQEPLGALADADAATALGVLTVEQERATAMVEAQAVATLRSADRYESALARLEALPTAGVDPKRLGYARMERIRLLSALGRMGDVRAVVREGPLVVSPGPDEGKHLLGRAQLLLDAGEVEAALADVDAAIAAGLEAAATRPAANLGAYCLAVLDRRDRLDEALAWANLACAPGLDGAPPAVGVRDTRAAVLAVAGRGAEAIPDLEDGLAQVLGLDATNPAHGWSHAFLARAHLDAGNLEEARRHAGEATRLEARTPVLDDVQRRLAGGPTATT